MTQWLGTQTKEKRLVNAKGHAVINTMAGNLPKTLAEAKFNTLGDILSNVNGEALVDTLADTLA